MRKLRRYTRLYGHFLAAHLKTMMEFRVDFIVGALSVCMIQFSSVFFIDVVFSQIQTLHGWNFYEVLFIYGIACLGRSIHHIFFDNLWTLGWQYIRSGNFDRVLMRPVNLLFQVVAERVQQDGFGQLIVGAIVFGTAVRHLTIDWTLSRVLLLPVMVIASGMVFAGLNLFFATFSFWMTDSLPLMWATFNISDFARYPITIYNGVIRTVLTWIIPYGFTAFFPAAVFLDHQEYVRMGLLSPVVAVVVCVVAYWFWGVGVKAYRSTGS